MLLNQISHLLGDWEWQNEFGKLALRDSFKDDVATWRERLPGLQLTDRRYRAYHTLKAVGQDVMLFGLFFGYQRLH
ncbi:hypothetical protein [Aminobacter sp. BE322]|uniref:hypothetical protein n=1 Tax=unclassified Aminobacter TaxID=2644704 RepID=UPI003D1A1A3D